MNLKYCPQRDVASISKTKTFNSTVSKYDPRTKRTTRIINCVPYDELIAKDLSKCCFPEPLPPPPPPFPPITTQTIYIYVDTTGGYAPTFNVTLTGTGYFIYGYDGIPHLFSASSPTLYQFNPVYNPESNVTTTISIHTSDLTYLDISDNSMSRIYSVDISDAPTLQTFIATSTPTVNISTFDISGNPNLRYLDLFGTELFSVNYFDYCQDLTFIDIRNNYINQGVAENMAERLVSNGRSNGTLKISTQANSGVVDTNSGVYFTTLRDSLGWNIT